MKKIALHFLAFLGILVGLASVAGLVYFGLVVMLVGGLIQVVHALKQTDIQVLDVAWGLARVLLAGVGTGLLFWILVALNALMWAAIKEGFDSCRPNPRAAYLRNRGW